jgi:hypothetical protein
MSDVSLNTNQQQPARNWWRMSLRTFLLGITLFCVVLGYWSYRVREQRSAVTILERNSSQRIGLIKTNDWLEFFQTAKINNSEPPKLSNLPHRTKNAIRKYVNDAIQVLPSDFRETVIYVNIPKFESFPYYRLKDISEEEWIAISKLRNLLCLTIDCDALQDSHIKIITQLESLECLSLHSNRLTDYNIMQLQKLTKLKYLDIQSPLVTQDKIDELSQAMKNCSIRFVSQSCENFE